MKENKTSKTKIFKGLNRKSFSAISSLLNSYTKRQIGVIVSTVLFSLVMFSMTLGAMIGGEVLSNLLRVLFISNVLTPVLFLCLFSIPSTISNMHSSTLIKRVGATRLNEKGYALIIWTIYYLRALIYFVISFVAWALIFTIVGDAVPSIDYEMFKIISVNLFQTILFCLLLIMFLN